MRTLIVCIYINRHIYIYAYTKNIYIYIIYMMCIHIFTLYIFIHSYIYIYTLYTHAYCIYVRNVFILYITCRIKIQEIYRRFRFPVLFFYFIAFPNMCNGLAHILHLKATLLPKVGPGQRTFHFQ